MLILFDTDGRGPSARGLVLRGVAMTAAAALVIGVLLLKSVGGFDSTFTATAALEQLGDGLPAKSDVKFRGVVVGTVVGVTPATKGGPNQVHMALDPTYARGIPRTVTARVVPSNVFAVSSVQLVDNGPAPSLPADSRIPQDRSLSTVQLQTALTKLREIVAATGRLGTSTTVGVLAAVAQATDRRGSDLVRTGRQLDEIIEQFNTLVTPDGGPSTITALTDAVRGLDDAAPDLLDALHHATVSMRTLAQRDDDLTTLLAAGNSTTSTVGSALDNRTDQLVSTSRQMAPVLDIWAAGSTSFTQIVETITHLSSRFLTEFWKPKENVGLGKFILEFTPHTTYTRADCPRYGELAAPSCTTAPDTAAPPTIPPVLDPRTYPAAVLTPEVRELLTRVLDGDANAAEALLAQLLPVASVPEGGAR